MKESQLRHVIRQMLSEDDRWIRGAVRRVLREDDGGGDSDGYGGFGDYGGYGGGGGGGERSVLGTIFLKPFEDAFKAVGLAGKDMLNSARLVFTTALRLDPQALKKAREEYSQRNAQIASEWGPILQSSYSAIADSDLGLATLTLAPSVFFAGVITKASAKGPMYLLDTLQKTGWIDIMPTEWKQSVERKYSEIVSIMSRQYYAPGGGGSGASVSEKMRRFFTTTTTTTTLTEEAVPDAPTGSGENEQPPVPGLESLSKAANEERKAKARGTKFKGTAVNGKALNLVEKSASQLGGVFEKRANDWFDSLEALGEIYRAMLDKNKIKLEELENSFTNISRYFDQMLNKHDKSGQGAIISFKEVTEKYKSALKTSELPVEILEEFEKKLNTAAEDIEKSTSTDEFRKQVEKKLDEESKKNQGDKNSASKAASPENESPEKEKEKADKINKVIEKEKTRSYIKTMKLMTGKFTDAIPAAARSFAEQAENDIRGALPESINRVWSVSPDGKKRFDDIVKKVVTAIISSGGKKT